jgi:hypothetical protein
MNGRPTVSLREEIKPAMNEASSSQLALVTHQLTKRSSTGAGEQRPTRATCEPGAPVARPNVLATGSSYCNRSGAPALRGRVMRPRNPPVRTARSHEPRDPRHGCTAGHHRRAPAQGLRGDGGRRRRQLLGAPGRDLRALGRNGAGKTTTVECISGLRVPDGGDVQVLGLDPRQDRERFHERLGVQLQQGALPPKLKVSEAVELYASFYERPADAAKLLDRLGLEAKRASY